MASSSLMDALFQRTLDDVIKGLRRQLIEESTFMAAVVEEVRREIKSPDLQTKSVALQKLTYLNAIHFVDMSWAAFHAIECISSVNFCQKKIGYLAVSQSFDESTPVIMLMINQLRKDLRSSNEHEVSLALHCLSRVGTVDLCRDITPEVLVLMRSSKVSVRKKAISVVVVLFEKYPDSVAMCFERVVEILESSDAHMQSAVIGAFCELTATNPRSYLPFAPTFHKILLDSKNNWVLIKVLKIFTRLAPLEPRLAKWVVDPICDHMNRTGAISLVYECIRTVLTSFHDHESATKLASIKIRELLVHDDPNLKYLGLNSLSIIAPVRLWPVLQNKEVVIKSLSHNDPGVKLQALHLVMAMVSDGNVVEISKVLLNYASKSDPEFCDAIIGCILTTCSRNVYQVVEDFDWYVLLLGEMARLPHCHQGEEMEKQLVDIGMRVKDARPQLLHVGRDLLVDPALLGNHFLHLILSAAAWVSGEYVEFSKNPLELVEALLQPRTRLLPPSVQAIYLHSAFKVLSFCLHSFLAHADPATDGIASTTSSPPEKRSFTHEYIVHMISFIELGLRGFAASCHVEIFDRVRNIVGFIESVKKEIVNAPLPESGNSRREEVKAAKLVEMVRDALSEELGPVSQIAQERIPVPDGITLKQNLAELDGIMGDATDPTVSAASSSSSLVNQLETGDSRSFLAEHRKRHELFYLASDENEARVDELPVRGDDSKSGIPPGEEDDEQDLAELAEKLLALKSKPQRGKRRPVVVKLGEEDGEPIARSSHDSIEFVSSSSIGEKFDDRNPSSRRKHGSHGNGGSKRNPQDTHGSQVNADESKDRARGKQHRHRRKHRQRVDELPKTVMETKVFPDLLL